MKFRHLKEAKPEMKPNHVDSRHVNSYFSVKRHSRDSKQARRILITR